MTDILDETPTEAPFTARVKALVSDEWSWAAANAGLPQVDQIVLETSSPAADARVTVTLTDGDRVVGATTAFEGPLVEGENVIASACVPLAASYMAGVDETRPATCTVRLEVRPEGGHRHRAMAQAEYEVDLEPKDLWLWSGDPRYASISDEAIENEDQLTRRIFLARLGRSLLASFVRPNNPIVAQVAREASSLKQQATGDPSFAAFQEPDLAKSEQSVEETVAAVYEALRGRQISYSEPPPQWDYRSHGQRIREHDVVANGGLGTCMDTTVLLAATLEHVGLHPVLVLVPGHIFVGYWRRDPFPSGRKPEWYPDSPIVQGRSRIASLTSGRFLGAIETTTMTTGTSATAAQAREVGLQNLASFLQDPDGAVTLIDVAAARHAGVHPLPAVRDRADGAVEVIEYRPGSDAKVTVVQTEQHELSERRIVDSHPPRYRSWKSSLLSLTPSSALINLGSGPGVQPIVLPPEGLGRLEDRLHEDVEFEVHGGFDLPEVFIARGQANAVLLDPADQLSLLDQRKLYMQRISQTRSNQGPVRPATFASELRSLARRAKEAREERGMNPLFVAIGLVRWPYESARGTGTAEAPIILVPVNLTIRPRSKHATLSLDPTSQTGPNYALIEFLRREYEIEVPALEEPQADRAGLDVEHVITSLRSAVAQSGRQLDVVSEARLTLLDLASFRMWKDLDQHAKTFLSHPLINHLVHTPTEPFIDPAAARTDDAPGTDDPVNIESIEAPVPADAAQLTAVSWAGEGRTFVLQGPPGTGKSQTITNIIAHCVTSGMKILFVAEKQTALTVVQRRLDAIGLTPFTLNLHHEGSSPAEVRAQLRSSMTTRVHPDETAMESARRRLRNAHYRLEEYPHNLHSRNAAGLSAYSANDQLLVLGDGVAVDVPTALVARDGDAVTAIRELLADLQPVAGAARVRPHHPWRLAGPQAAGKLDVDAAASAVRAVLQGLEWTETLSGPARDAIDAVVAADQFGVLAAASDPRLPTGDVLRQVLDPAWPESARHALQQCEQAITQERSGLAGFAPEVLTIDLDEIARQIADAGTGNVFSRKSRRAAAFAPVLQFAQTGAPMDASVAEDVVATLRRVQQLERWIRATLLAIPGLTVPQEFASFGPDGLRAVTAWTEELVNATAPLRVPGEATDRARTLAVEGTLLGHHEWLQYLSSAWQAVVRTLAVRPADLDAWREGRGLTTALNDHRSAWREDVEHGRLLQLQRWVTLASHLEPLETANMHAFLEDLVTGRMPADQAEEAFARGVARASLTERLRATGLDTFDSSKHDQRVLTFAAAERELRSQWVTSGPAKLLETRGGSGLSFSGSSTGALARELEKSRGRLGTRALLQRHGAAIQSLTPIILASPASAVDLIRPGSIDFDVAVFDEASQITVPEAIGAMGRAKSAIVVGDSKQMPPSQRIGGRPSEEEEYLESADGVEVVDDQESILGECELARVPTLQLAWHYRSQDEALIAFSNRAYYQGKLSSFPTPTLLSSATGVEFRKVDGHYIRASKSQGGREPRVVAPGITAGTNTNPEEALAIVRTVGDLIDASPDGRPSLGIVTFNEQQRSLIEELLYASPDPRVLALLDEKVMGPTDVLVVKALEQVQGDERDVILFSVAFSKQANGRIPLNFGRLSNLGGERRLNVAVTRARRKNIVFCSFEPWELEAEKSSYLGVKDLKRYLEFARKSAQLDTTSDAHRAAIRDRHRDAVADALRERGLHVLTDVGMSDFRLDLVLARSEAPDRLVLPVLLDGESWNQRATVSDRDVLPIEVLRNIMGWPTVARLWWPMWLQNRELAVQALLDEFDQAEDSLNRRIQAAVTQQSEGASDLQIEPEGAQEVDDPSRTEAAPVNSVRALPAGVEVSPPSTHAESIGYPPHDAEHEDASATAASRAEPDSIERGQFHPSPHTHGMSKFVPAHTEVVGPRTVLDALPESSASALVLEQVLDVIEAEGPIELTRLSRIVARRFGLNKVRAARADDITRLIPSGQIHRGRLGSFAWPAGLSPVTWSGFRYSDSGANRTLEEVAPEELVNAMLSVQSAHASEDETLRRTAEIFGITRLGAHVRSRLESTFSLVEKRLEVAASPEKTFEPEDVARADVTPSNVVPVTPEIMALSGPVSSVRSTELGQAEPVASASSDAGVWDVPDPVIQQLARDYEGYCPDLDKLDRELYYDYSRGGIMPKKLRKLVNEIVLDSEYDGERDNHVLTDRTDGLSEEESDAVEYAVWRVWKETFGRRLSRTVRKIVLHLASDPEFEPLPWEEDVNQFVSNRMVGLRPVLVTQVKRQLNQYAHDNGSVDALEEEIKKSARAALMAMTALDRDVYGFTNRNAKRLLIAEPYIKHIKPSRLRFVIYWMSRFEAEDLGLLREARYATAIRALRGQGATRAAISRALGISGSIMDRIERENRRDVVLGPDDPILTSLAPSLAQ